MLATRRPCRSCSGVQGIARDACMNSAAPRSAERRRRCRGERTRLLLNRAGRTVSAVSGGRDFSFWNGGGASAGSRATVRRATDAERCRHTSLRQRSACPVVPRSSPSAVHQLKAVIAEVPPGVPSEEAVPSAGATRGRRWGGHGQHAQHGGRQHGGIAAPCCSGEGALGRGGAGADLRRWLVARGGPAAAVWCCRVTPGRGAPLDQHLLGSDATSRPTKAHKVSS